MTTSTVQVLDARSPADLLAAVPLLLGFVPEESVVLLTFGAADSFHARLDLPRSRSERKVASVLFAEPCLRLGVRQVILIVYSADPCASLACVRALARRFAEDGIVVLDAIRASDDQWFAMRPGRDGGESPGLPFDRASHVFTAEAVALGRVVRSSREELAASVAPDAEGVAAVDAALRLAGGPVEGHRVIGLVTTLLADGGPPDPGTAAQVLTALQRREARDELLLAADRRSASGQLDTWSALVRVAPPGLVAPVASVLAFLAWLAGDGALAWCALERASSDRPACGLADVVTRVLEQALPPTVWDHG
jgi:hypothetical protein